MKLALRIYFVIVKFLKEKIALGAIFSNIWNLNINNVILLANWNKNVIINWNFIIYII